MGKSISPAACCNTSVRAAADRIGQAHVSHDPFPEEGGDSAEGAVHELVGEDEVHRCMLDPERSDGTGGNDMPDPKTLEPVDIGPKIQFGRQQAVSSAMPGQKRHRLSLELSQEIGIAGVPEGCGDTQHPALLEWHVVEAAAADDSDPGFAHIWLPILSFF